MTLLNPLIYSNSLYIFWIFSVYHMHLNIGMCMLSHLSHAQLFVTLGTVAHQSLQSLGFSRQEYWSGLPFLLQGIFPPQRLKLRFLCVLHWQAGSLPLALPVFPFVEALFIIDKVWKQPKCSSVDKWIKKMWYTHTHTHIHTGILLCHKKNEILLLVAKVGLGGHYAKWNKSDKDKYCMILLICEV